MNGTVLITGATGNVGSEVLTNLLGRGVSVRAAVTDEASAARLPADVSNALFDFEDPATFGAALKNVERVFLMRPPHMGDASRFEPFIEAMTAAGVEHVVFLSLLGAEQNPVVPHRAIEKRLLASGLGCTMLRPSFYMQNLTTTHLDDIRDRGEIIVPAGRGRTSFIDVRDIGAAAALVLAEHGHIGSDYALTGTVALSYYECAETLSRVTGRTITYTNPSGRQFARHMEQRGFPKEFITVMRGIYFVAKIRMASTVTDDFEKLLDREPISFEQFAIDRAAMFNLNRDDEG
ncbi:MAG: SDR family oxidoreductase [Actinomycetota bacterium]|nr:SDR family oxidoreductase [Actinomycetota bacterium]